MRAGPSSRPGVAGNGAEHLSSGGVDVITSSPDVLAVSGSEAGTDEEELADGRSGQGCGEGSPDRLRAADGTKAPGRSSLLYPLKHLGGARQLILVMPRSWTGTVARLEAYEKGPNGWQCVVGSEQVRVGRTGMIPAPRRVSGSGTTPAGTFPLTTAFGLDPDPGTALPYVHVTSEDHWWVADPISAHYNELRDGAAGGFLTRESGNRASERIAAHPQEYAHALMIDFNRPFPDRKQGACISMRISTGLSTGGSIGVDRDLLVELLRWLDPAKGPVITMAPERVVSQY